MVDLRRPLNVRNVVLHYMRSGKHFLRLLSSPTPVTYELPVSDAALVIFLLVIALCSNFSYTILVRNISQPISDFWFLRMLANHQALRNNADPNFQRAVGTWRKIGPVRDATNSGTP